jgi:hypothetical protein
MTLTVILTLVNSESSNEVLTYLTLLALTVPLSAYETQQDYSFTPNDTMTARILPYSNLIPASLRLNHGNFLPHTFLVGDTFQTNYTLFNLYTIERVYTCIDNPESPPRAVTATPSFAFMNYDFGRTCDVRDITVSLTLSPVQDVQATVCLLHFHYSS